MLKKKVLVILLSCLLLFLITLLLGDSEKHRSMLTRMITISDSKSTTSYIDNDLQVIELDVSEMENDGSSEKNTEEETNTDVDGASEKTTFQEVVSEAALMPQPVVYDGMTLEELASKLDRSLKNELSGKGYLYASYSLEKGVDPYLAVAISLEETGCNWNCSRLVKSCNNVGGMKGSGCGSYGAFPNLDDGIRAFIDNIYRNYVAYGLTTADNMNPKYAENPAWAGNVNAYITRIKNN